ncbi:MAG: prepilin-type N-terminal cleavage/methylation domain-containing protein [bacterium]|nr:prepilin-type N-terminal cleavage/methylation domain-containing protein [bacterium]
MNKKGFSLVEMLLVLVLIAIVSMIVLPNISKMTSSSKEKEIEGYLKLLEENLNLYVIDKKESIVWNNNQTEITYDELKKVNPDIKIDKCVVDKLLITRTEQETVSDITYKYNYSICITCNEQQYCK